MTSSSPILIVGGGIGGLAAACLFGQNAIPVIVFEQRSFETLETGAGLQLSPNATRILYGLGIGPEVRARAHEPTRLHIQSLEPSWGQSRITSMDFSACETTYGFPYWTIRRWDLHQILYQHVRSLPSVTLCPEHTCEAFTIQGNMAEIIAQTPSGKSTFTGHMIIGADGVHSRVRQWIYGTTGIRPSGMCAFRYVLSAPNLPEPWTTDSGLWLSPQGHIVHYPLGMKKDINVVAVQKNPISLHSSHNLERWIRKVPEGLSWLSEFLKPDTLWQPYTLYTPTQKAPYWGDPHRRAFLLGDSAHPIFPFLAQGAALALEDAHALFQSFHRSSGNPSRFFAHYTKVRGPRTHFIRGRTLFTGHMYHMPSILTPFRNLGLSLLGSKGLQGLQRPIYGFKN